MKRIQAKRHKIGMYEIEKISLCFDDKRYVLDDGVNTLAYFLIVIKNVIKIIIIMIIIKITIIIIMIIIITINDNNDQWYSPLKDF